MTSLRVPLPPPLLFFIALLGGAALDHFLPWRLVPMPTPLRLGLGGFLFLEALALGFWALRTLRQSSTSPNFGQPVRTLVAAGPYRFTRNPLYVSLVLLLSGFAMVLDSGWVGVGVPLLIGALNWLVILREERFLSEVFGADYADYRARVRRWV